jgi:hypothetical protein
MEAIVIRQLVGLLFYLSLSVYGGFAVAATQPTIGEVVSAQGQVTAIDIVNQERILQRHSTIYLHDRVVTGQASKAQIRLHDDSIIIVQPASEFHVSEFSFNKGSPDNSKYVGNIVKGALINISGQGETKNYQLRSSLTTIAFRGTGLATKLISKGTALTNQEVYVFEGSVTVNNRCDIIGGGCVSGSIDIGRGMQVNSATIDARGRIQGVKSSGLLSECVGTMEIGRSASKQGAGGDSDISVKCKR